VKQSAQRQSRRAVPIRWIQIGEGGDTDTPLANHVRKAIAKHLTEKGIVPEGIIFLKFSKESKLKVAVANGRRRSGPTEDITMEVRTVLGRLGLLA